MTPSVANDNPCVKLILPQNNAKTDVKPLSPSSPVKLLKNKRQKHYPRFAGYFAQSAILVSDRKKSTHRRESVQSLMSWISGINVPKCARKCHNENR